MQLPEMHGTGRVKEDALLKNLCVVYWGLLTLLYLKRCADCVKVSVVTISISNSL